MAAFAKVIATGIRLYDASNAVQDKLKNKLNDRNPNKNRRIQIYELPIYKKTMFPGRHAVCRRPGLPRAGRAR